MDKAFKTRISHLLESRSEFDFINGPFLEENVLRDAFLLSVTSFSILSDFWNAAQGSRTLGRRLPPPESFDLSSL